MTSKTLKKNLLAISNDILISADFHDKLAPAILKYHDLLCQIAAIDPEGESDREHIETKNGNAIGSFWAANCVKEIFRTQRFVKGLSQAIKDLHRQGHKTVHILYAGTGPFAALALPIMLNFEPTQVQFTLLEINKNSYDRLRMLLEHLDLMPYVKRLELADASNYQIRDKDIAIILSETMNLALFKEPQVSIMLNFGRQLDEKVIYIPQEINVSVCKQESTSSVTPLKKLIQFDGNYIREKVKNSTPGPWEFEKIGLEIDLNTNDRLSYLTEITIYKEFKLGLNDSSLTLLKSIKPSEKTGKLQLEFQYQVSENPGFVVKKRNSFIDKCPVTGIPIRIPLP